MEHYTEVKIPPLARKKRRKLTPAGIALLLGFFLLCAWLGYWMAQNAMDPLVPKDNNENVQPAFQTSEVLNVLLMGVDQRDNEPARADTIILASLHLTDKEIHLLSIPRDTRVEIPGKGIMRKINYAHAVGGADLTIDTVENFLGIPVHYFVETNFKGFSNMIDILGGVTLNVEQRMYFPEEDINLKSGLQKLSGHDALSYVRWRSDGRGDIGRIERQQKFFQALTDQAMSFSTVWKIPELLDELNKQVETDMKLQKMLVLANKFKDIDNIKLDTTMVPGTPDEVNYGGSYWIADKKALDTMLKDIYNLEVESKLGEAKRK